MVHQHFKLIDVFTAAQNIVLGPGGNKYGVRRINDEVKEIAERYGFELDPKRRSTICRSPKSRLWRSSRCSNRGADILILDEPTAVLTPQETEKLFTVMRAMKAGRKGPLSSSRTSCSKSWRSPTAWRCSERVPISVAWILLKQMRQALTEMMVGQKVELEIERPVTKIDRPLLEIRDLSVRSDEGSIAIEGLNFFIRGGEILGVAGIAGCGQRELCEAIAGLRKVESGGIYHEGDSIVGFSPKQIAARGISMSFIPEDRLGMGLAPSMSITDNMMLKKYQDHRYSIKPVAAKEGEKNRLPKVQTCVECGDVLHQPPRGLSVRGPQVGACRGGTGDRRT